MQLVKLPFSNTTITIYNRYIYTDTTTNKLQTKWQRTVVPNCYWGKHGKQVNIGGLLVGSDDYIVQMPQDTNYRDKWEWNGEKVLYTADKGDIFVTGIITDEIPLNGSAAEITAKYSGRTLIVKEVQNNTGKDVPLGHIAVIGK